MKAATCKCGEMQAWGEMWPCNTCEKCGTAPGYSNTEPHRFKQIFDQNTGQPYLFCARCGTKAAPATDEEQRAEPKWVPVTERLPQGDQLVLITLRDLLGDLSSHFAWFMNFDKRFHVDEDGNSLKWNGVIAWMPLPEPYKQ